MTIAGTCVPDTTIVVLARKLGSVAAFFLALIGKTGFHATDVPSECMRIVESDAQ